MSLYSLQGKHESLMTGHNENQIGMSVPSLKPLIVRFFVLNDVLASIVRQFVNVRWQTLATVLHSQRCQRCYRHSCNRRCVVHHSHSPIQRLNPAFFEDVRRYKKSEAHLALPASCHSVEESSLCQRPRSIHSPSIVLGNFWSDLLV